MYQKEEIPVKTAFLSETTLLCRESPEIPTGLFPRALRCGLPSRQRDGLSTAQGKEA